MRWCAVVRSGVWQCGGARRCRATHIGCVGSAWCLCMSVYGCMYGCVWQCSGVQWCAVVRGGARLCAVVRGGVGPLTWVVSARRDACVCVRWCPAVRGGARWCAAV